ncbi:MAG: DUF342 domain-containing protein [Desulfobacterales bacterium]|nr:DUF342 domain-containing protein [Desulfobacterales bacterium]
MEESQKYKILVVEADGDLRLRIEKLLTSQNYVVSCFESSSAAFSELESPDIKPYAVAIVSYKMPKMKGDEVLEKIKELSPDTQRVLITDSLSIDIIAKAINTAEINSCLSLPFKDEDLISQASNGCRQFQEVKKQQNLIRVTQHQNNQLYKIAKQLKEKEERNVEKIRKRKNKIRLAESELSLNNSKHEPLSLKGVIKEKDVPLTPEGLLGEFSILKDQIKEILGKAVGDFIGLDELSYKDIKEKASQKHQSSEEVDKILKISFMLLRKTAFLGVDALDAVQESSCDGNDFELTLSEDKTKAFIRLKTSDIDGINIITIKELLEQEGIKVGIKDDDFIQSWLLGASPEDDAIIIAKGRKPKPPKNAEINYHFPLEFRQPGKVDSEGRIDFKERGEIPFVEKDTFLAAKIFPEDGIAGINVLGEIMPVEEPLDMVFVAGTGVRESDDGVKIYADIDGQPNLDPLGNISVFPELKIDGDVCFESGNVEFDGNIIVSGMIKEGFTVKGASLTIEQIEGAEVDLTGDLSVSSGIVDANLIKVKGNIQAKYVNNSKIYGFGDLIVQKEILDSKIRVSGACINEGGTIIASDISAKMGIDAGNIGTMGSRPSTLKVGIDEHTNFLVAKIDSKLKVNIDIITILRSEILELDKEDQALHITISEHAYTQDRTQVKLKDVEKKKFDLQASGNAAALQKVFELEAQMQEQAKQAEDEINRGFERQDAVAQEIVQKKERIGQLDKTNEALMEEKKKLLEFTSKKEPVPVVKVAKKIMSGTKIQGPTSVLTIKESTSRCRIMEIKQTDEGMGSLGFYEMVITDL